MSLVVVSFVHAATKTSGVHSTFYIGINIIMLSTGTVIWPPLPAETKNDVVFFFLIEPIEGSLLLLKFMFAFLYGS